MSILEAKVNALMALCTAESEGERKSARQELLRLQECKVICDPADPEDVIQELLMELGAPDSLIGHPYAAEAIRLCLSDRKYIDNVTFVLYPAVAAKFGTTATRTERALRHLVEVIWTRGNVDVLDRYFGNTVSPDKGKPTNGEFVARCAAIVKLRLKSAAK